MKDIHTPAWVIWTGTLGFFVAVATFFYVASAMNSSSEPPSLIASATPSSSPSVLPTACPIKGNTNFETGEKIYHLPSDPYYAATEIETEKGERYFCSEAEAAQAGWRHAKPPPNYGSYGEDACEQFENQEDALDEGIECEDLPSQEELYQEEYGSEDSGYE